MTHITLPSWLYSLVVLHFKKENNGVPGTSLTYPLMLMVNGAEETLTLRQVIQKLIFFVGKLSHRNSEKSYKVAR